MLIVIVILIIIVVVLIILFRKFKKPNEDEIIVKASNVTEIGMDYLYEETIICDDGSVYEFTTTERSSNVIYNYNCKINKKDLEKIKEYSRNLDEEKYLTMIETETLVQPYGGRFD